VPPEPARSDPARSDPARPARQVAALVAAVLATVPGLALRISGAHPAEWVAATAFGLAIVGGAFLLAWGAEALQLDVSQGLALALLALIAVLPEYLVDFVFAWKAGKDPHTFAPLALANMTGGNRLLIGVGWSMVVLVAAWRMTRLAEASGYVGELDTRVSIERSHSIEVAYLALATVFSLTLPLKRSLTALDSLVLLTIFLAYMLRITRAPAEEPHLVGPARLVGALPPRPRRAVVTAMFLTSAGVIGVSAAPFANSLVSTGRELGISTFLLVQWVAPLASEAPELLVAGLFAWRLNTNAALGTLVSSKVNQWTLLVGSLPIVFAVSAGGLHGLPLDSLQREELFLTAAQSAFAVSVLANRSIGVKEALGLLTLFGSQFVLGGVLPGGARAVERVGVGTLYLVLAAGILWRQRAAVPGLLRDGFRTPTHELALGDDLASEPA